MAAMQAQAAVQAAQAAQAAAQASAQEKLEARQDDALKVDLPGGLKVKLPKSEKLRGPASILLAVLVACGYMAFNHFKDQIFPPEGTLHYAAIEVDPQRADPDKFLVGVDSRAERWKSDAAFWAMTLPGVRPDGTIDLTTVDVSPMITYISVNDVQSQLKTTRKDSVKKFTFGKEKISHGTIWGASEPWTGVVPPPPPRCTIKGLVSTLGEMGFQGDQSVCVMFDPKWTDRLAWSVDQGPGQLTGHYDWNDCSKID